MKIKFNKEPLAVEQNNCATKIVNAFIVYYLDIWLTNPPRNSTLKNCLFGVTRCI